MVSDCDGSGCMDSSACNYNNLAITDNGSCVIPPEYYNCEGECISFLDCNGVCGGPLLGAGIDNLGNDECGICGGGGIADGKCDCDGNSPTDLWGSDNYDCFGAELSLFNGLVPEGFSIHSIYPNPFNPITNINYGLPEHANVRIVVFDLSGKQVSTLINQFQAPGYHVVDWNADHYPSGVYFIRIDSE